MSGDRPTHAATVRPAMVEIPLWLIWRLGPYVLRVWDAGLDAVEDVVDIVGDKVDSYVAAYRGTTSEQRRLLVVVVYLTAALALACGVFAVALFA